METQVYLVRHGETTWNRENRLQGHLDSPLTETGIMQAQSLADHLKGIPFQAAYSSDLGRALQTARIILSRHADTAIICDERIRERHFGIFQGLTWEEIGARYPEEARNELSGNPMNIVPGGESKHHLLARVRLFFDDLIRLHPGQRIIIISHGGVLNVWIKHVLNVPLEKPRRFHLGNSTVNILCHSRENWYLKTLGVTPEPLY